MYLGAFQLQKIDAILMIPLSFKEELLYKYIVNLCVILNTLLIFLQYLDENK